MLTLYNADGTVYDPPMTSEYRAMIKKLKTCDTGIGYDCMFCNKCPYGDYFKCPDELKPVIEQQREAIRQYNLQHNNANLGSLFLAESK